MFSHSRERAERLLYFILHLPSLMIHSYYIYIYGYCCLPAWCTHVSRYLFTHTRSLYSSITPKSAGRRRRRTPPPTHRLNYLIKTRFLRPDSHRVCCTHTHITVIISFGLIETDFMIFEQMKKKITRVLVLSMRRAAACTRGSFLLLSLSHLYILTKLKL